MSQPTKIPTGLEDLASLLGQLGVTMSTAPTTRDIDMPAGSDHQKCTFSRSGAASIAVDFSRGPGNGKAAYPGARLVFPPLHPSEVLWSAVRDTFDTDFEFEDWCHELGYDPDSRKAHKIWLTCQDMARRLRRFFGDDLAAVQKCVVNADY